MTGTELAESAPGYRPGRTLPFRVEAIRQWKRRRTFVMAAILAALPVILAAAFVLGGGSGGSSEGADIVATATLSGVNFAATVLFFSSSFLLVLPVALFFGDTVASEAGWSSLRYLLAAPIPRTRLLVSKIVVALIFSVLAITFLVMVSLIVGTIAYGWGPLQMPGGAALPATTALARFGIVIGFIMLSQSATAGLAFWLSTRTDAPLGAVGGAVGLTIISGVLDQVTVLGEWRDYLPSHWQNAWFDALQPQIVWSGMLQGVSVAIAYALVLFSFAFRGFARKDIVS